MSTSSAPLTGAVSAGLVGDATKGREQLGRTPTVGFGDTLARSVNDDLELVVP